MNYSQGHVDIDNAYFLYRVEPQPDIIEYSRHKSSGYLYRKHYFKRTD